MVGAGGQPAVAEVATEQDDDGRAEHAPSIGLRLSIYFDNGGAIAERPTDLAAKQLPRATDAICRISWR